MCRVAHIKPRPSGTPRVREPRIQASPTPHERTDDERIVRPVDIPDGEEDTDEDNDVDQSQENPAGPRVTGSPSSSSRAKPPYQVRRHDLTHPIPPPTDADERDGDWSAMH